MKRVRDTIREMDEKMKELQEGYVDALCEHLRLLGLDATKVVPPKKNGATHRIERCRKSLGFHQAC